MSLSLWFLAVLYPFSFIHPYTFPFNSPFPCIWLPLSLSRSISVSQAPSWNKSLSLLIPWGTPKEHKHHEKAQSPQKPCHMTRAPAFPWEARSADGKVELQTSWTASNSSYTFSWSNKKQGNSVKWSVFDNSLLNIIWQTLGKKNISLCLTLVNYVSVTIVFVGGELWHS